MSDERISWTWRHAIAKSRLPATTKHVLLTISIHMNELGQGAYPTQEDLAEETSLTERSVRTQIKKAIDAGWLVRREHGFRGQKWRNHEYSPRWPDLLDIEKGAETGSPPFPKGAERRDRKVRKEVPPNVSDIIPITPPPPEAGSPARFQDVVELWPEEDRGDLERAERAFNRVDPDERANVFAAADTYCAMMRKRLFSNGGGEGHLTIRGFLVADTYRDFVDAPPIGKGGRFVITPDRPEEWQAWVEWAARIGPAATRELEAAQRVNTMTRWPQDMNGGRDE